MNNQFLANHHFLTLSVLIVMSMTACGSHSSSGDDVLANNKATNNKATNNKAANNNAIQSPVTPTNPNPTTPTNNQGYGWKVVAMQQWHMMKTPLF